jgi:valyl-tRNA synthetase
MPFITEELWHVLRAKVRADGWPDSILAAPYPATGAVDEGAERGFQPLLDAIDAIRNVRGEMNVAPRAQVAVDVASEDPAVLEVFRRDRGLVQRLANVARCDVHAAAATRPAPTSAVAVGRGFELRVHFGNAVDVAAETARIDKEIGKLDQDLAGLVRKLENPSFVQKAPPEVVEKDRARAGELREKRGKLEAHRAMLSGAEGLPGANPARREAMENQNPQDPSQPPPPVTQPAATPMEQVVSTAVEVGKAAVGAVMAGAEAALEKVRAARAPAKAKKPAAKRKPARKAARKAAPRKAARKAKKPARKAARKPARKPARRAAKARRGGKKR